MRTYSFINCESGPMIVFVCEATAGGSPAFLSTMNPINLSQMLSNDNHAIQVDVDIDDDSAIKFIKKLGGMYYNTKHVCYSKTREYGGPEEGGWYYTCYSSPFKVEPEMMADADSAVFDEFLFGENETKGRPIYQ